MLYCTPQPHWHHRMKLKPALSLHLCVQDEIKRELLQFIFAHHINFLLTLCNHEGNSLYKRAQKARCFHVMATKQLFLRGWSHVMFAPVSHLYLFTKENYSLVSFRKFMLLFWQPPTEKSWKCHISRFLSINSETKGSKLKFNESKVSKFVYFTFRSHAINLLSFTSQKVHRFVGRYGMFIICMFCFYLFVKLILKVLNWWRIDPMLGGIYSSPQNNMF